MTGFSRRGFTAAKRDRFHHRCHTTQRRVADKTGLEQTNQCACQRKTDDAGCHAEYRGQDSSGQEGLKDLMEDPDALLKCLHRAIDSQAKRYGNRNHSPPDPTRARGCVAGEGREPIIASWAFAFHPARQ